MFLGTPHQTKQITDYHNIYLDGCKLVRVQEAKFLGLIIDENLKWKKQISNICKLCSRNIGVLNKVKFFLPKQTMYQLYCSMVLCYINYGILLWGGSCKEYLNKLFRLQKRALRIISNSSYLTASKPLFEKFNALNTFNIYKKEVAIFMYKYKHNMLPQSFNNIFTILKDVHGHNTRNKTNYRIDVHKINGLLYTGPKIWNSLPNEVKLVESFGVFKRKVTTYLQSCPE